MKKTFLCSLAVFMCGWGCFADTCTSSNGAAKNVSLAGFSNQQATDNEFLYTNYTDYNELKALGRVNTFNQNSGTEAEKTIKHDLLNNGYTIKKGRVLECDKEICNGTSVVYMPNKGWAHDTTVNGEAGAYFVCSTAGQDQWLKQKLVTCPSNQYIAEITNFYTARDSGVTVSNTVSKDKGLYLLNGATICECKGKNVYDSNSHRCVVKDTDPKPNPTPKPKPNTNPDPDNCSQYAKGSEAYKCCTYTDNDGADWVNGQCVCRRGSLCGTRMHWNGEGCLPSEEAFKKVSEKHACENTNGAKWYEQGEVCRCDCPAGQHWVFDESKAVDYELGLITNDPQTGQRKSWDYALWKPLIANPGKCVGGGSGDSSPDNEEMSDCYYEFNMDITCSDSTKSYHRNDKRKLTKAEAESFGCKSGNVFATDFKEFASLTDIAEAEARNIAAARKLQKLVCGDNGGNYVVVNPTTPTTPQGPSAAEVKSAADKLSAFAVSAESNRNVWKDAEGKFNTARLASDLTAGVVLGTVGGVVSGVVIKKKQVQKGFEALHCTVGGQTIADWGDDFSVGLR